MLMDRGSRREGRMCIRARRRRSTTTHEREGRGFGLEVVKEVCLVRRALCAMGLECGARLGGVPPWEVLVVEEV